MTRQRLLRPFVTACLVAAANLPAHAGQLGVMIDGGVPDGANAALVFEPFSLVRVHAGGGYNFVSKGVRGGVTLRPFGWFLAPTLSLEAGRYFQGDANPLARMITGDPEFDEPALREVSYDYVNLRLGLELRFSRFLIYVHAGASRIDTELRHVDESFEMSDGAQIELRRDPKVRVFAPSARLGFIVYL